MLLKAADRVCTLTNIGNMQTWMAERTDKWLTGQTLTPAELSHGHALVFKICSGLVHLCISTICTVLLFVCVTRLTEFSDSHFPFLILRLTRCVGRVKPAEGHRGFSV